MKLFTQNEQEFKLLLNSLDYVLKADDCYSYEIMQLLVDQLENFDQTELGKLLNLIDEAALNETKGYSACKNNWVNLFTLIESQFNEIARKESLFTTDEDQILMIHLNLAYSLYIDNYDMNEIIAVTLNNLKYFSEEQLYDLLELLNNAKENSTNYKKHEKEWDKLLFKTVKRFNSFEKGPSLVKSN